MSKSVKPFSTGLVSFDFETKGLDVWNGGAKPFLLGLEDEQGNIIKARPGEREWGRAKEILASPVDKVGWNIKFDLSVATKEGMQLGGKFHDAMLMCYMNDEYERDLRLKGVGHRHFGREPQEEQFVKAYLAALKRKGKVDVNYSDIPKEKMDSYIEEDLDLTLMAAWKFGHVREESSPQRRVYAIESELIPNVVKMEQRGIAIDRAYCKKMAGEMGPRIAALEKKLHDMAGVKFNPNSRIQLDAVLRAQGLDTGVASEPDEDGERIMKTGLNYMAKLADHPFVLSLLEWRGLRKLNGTYFEPLYERSNNDGNTVHPSFWPFGQEKGGIKTGRFSCSEPNLQNIPAGLRSHSTAVGSGNELAKDGGMVRRAVVPRPGYVFVLGDYAQIEFIIFACHAGDPRIMDSLRKGVDFHLATAHMMFGADCMDGKTPQEAKRLRFVAKELNFSLMYGMGVDKMALRTGWTIQKAREMKAQYFNKLPAARDFLLRSQADLIRDRFVQDQFGRRYHVPQEKCYKAANALCQGPAALVMKRGINRVFDRVKGLDAHPVLTIHDELFIEVRKSQVYDAVHALIEGMEDTETFEIPIRVDAALAETSWADKKKWKEVEDKWKPKRKVILVR